MPGAVDFAAEGLLDGLDGLARDARLTLLRRLHDDGVPLAHLREAVAGDRLALLPVDRILGSEARYTAREIAAEAGVDTQLLIDAHAAFGLPPIAVDERRLGAADLAFARRLRTTLDAGLPSERIVDVNRVLGRAMTQVAAATRLLVGEAFIAPGDTEDVVAERLATAAQMLMPSLAPTLERAFSLHLLELLRGDAIDAATLRSGELGGDEPVSVAFATSSASPGSAGRCRPTSSAVSRGAWRR